MGTIVGILLIIFIAFAGAKISFAKVPFIGGINFFFLTGTEFILVGLIFGPQFLNTLTVGVIEGMYPFIGLGLGWLGLVYGLQFDLAKLARIPKGYLRGSLFHSLLSIAIIFGLAYVILPFVGVEENILINSVVIAIIGSCSSQTALALISRDKIFRKSKTLRMLRFVSSLGELPGLILFGLLLSMVEKAHLFKAIPYPLIQWIVVSIGLGLVFGFIMIFVLHLKLKSDERLLFTIGLVLFSGGLAAYFQLSPLFVNFLSGLTVANFSRDHHLFDDIVSMGEKPIYLILLIIAGAGWSVSGTGFIVIAVAITIIRIAAKTMGFYFCRISFLRTTDFPKLSGLGLINQGGMALAMIINVKIFDYSSVNNMVISGIILSIMLNQLLGYKLTKIVLKSETTE